MFRKNDNSFNPFISRMENYMQIAIEGRFSNTPCAEEIVPMIKKFFKKSIRSTFKWNETGMCYHIMNITEIVKYLAYNTRMYEKLTDEDISSFRKIFDELDALHEEAMLHNSQSTYDDLSYKISCISEIVCKNMVGTHDSLECTENWRDGMIFQNYENLWKVIHRVNTEWKELCGRGFSLSVFYDYWESFKYDRSIGQEKTEAEKLKTFMALLDGTMKFVPVYELRAICFKVVDNDFKEVIVNTFENKYTNAYRLRQEGEEVSQFEVTED